MSVSSLTTRVALRPVALGISLLAITGGHAAYEASAKTLAVSVDGHVVKVKTHGDTVAKVLSAAHLTVNPHDLLAPSKATKVSDGNTIVLRRGRPMNLTIDGTTRTVWVTATSVNEALDQIGLRAQGAILSADRSRAVPLKGFSLEVRTRKTVQILDAGKVRRFVTNSLVLKDVLADAKVVLRPQDKLSLPLVSPVRNGLVVRINRIDGGHEGIDLPIPFSTERRADSSMFKGETKTLREGRVGVLHRNYKLLFLNHKLSKRILTSAHATAAPVTEIVAFGTKARPTHSASADGLNWAALARCESGGNPRSVSSNGEYRGLYQFSLGTWHGVGGSGDPIDASSGEQTYRAQILYRRSGRSPWPVCGRYL
ncbi:MAG: transglycosylase [Frankiales bacterium]|nr:transglycosylase [Frankiales bacterium]